MIVLIVGGTVDITVHEVMKESLTDQIHLKELHLANGGDWGGLNVDKEFQNFLDEVIGADVMEVVQNRHREDYMDLMDSFEIKKRLIRPKSDTKETIKLPIIIAQTYETLNHEKLENSSKIPKKYQGKIKFSKDKLRIDAEILKGFFEETCTQICVISREYLDQIRHYNVDKILMVGGFSESAILQEKVRKTFPGMRVIIPEEAGLAVLKGASLYGHNPSLIVSRACKYTYGICAMRNFEPALDPFEKKIIHGHHVLCKDRFSVHARKGQKFEFGEVTGENNYVPSDPDSSEMSIDVYTSEKETPRFVDDVNVKCIGHLKVPLNPRQGSKAKTVTVQFMFGKTELDVVAKLDGRETKASFDFLK